MNPDEIAALKRELARLKRSSRRSRLERGQMGAIVTLGLIVVFGLGFKLEATADGRKYSWNLDSSVIVNILQVLSGGSAIASGVMAAKNLSRTTDDDEEDAGDTLGNSK